MERESKKNWTEKNGQNRTQKIRGKNQTAGSAKTKKKVWFEPYFWLLDSSLIGLQALKNVFVCGLSSYNDDGI